MFTEATAEFAQPFYDGYPSSRRDEWLTKILSKLNAIPVRDLMKKNGTAAIDAPGNAGRVEAASKQPNNVAVSG